MTTAARRRGPRFDLALGARYTSTVFDLARYRMPQHDGSIGAPLQPPD